MQVEVTFLDHSGFSVSIGQHFLLFDYFRGMFPGNQIKQHKYSLAFASHSHKDHFNKKIFHMSKYNPGTRYVLSDDIKEQRDYAVMMKPGDVWKQDDIEVYAFGSTDIGVSFGVICEGLKIFHAGDFNLWTWNHQSTREEIDEATQLFEQELAQIPLFMNEFDIAFFPVDPRQWTDAGDGAIRFLEEVKTTHMFPMHMWGKYKFIQRFLRKYKGDTIVHTLENKNQKFELDI